MLTGLLGFLLLGCEKVPTFQELTGQDAAKAPPAVANSAAPVVTPATPSFEVKPVEPQKPPVADDPEAVMAVLTRKSGDQLTDRDILRATKVPSIVAELKSLDVSRSAVTDEGIRMLGQFTALTRLDMTSLQIDGSGLEGLAPLSNLRELTLSAVQMGSSAGWEHLGKLPQVESLTLTSANITDANVSTLLSMTGLKELNISNTTLTDAALAQLAKLEHLEILRMENTRQIHGVGLKAFVQPKTTHGLRCLYASSTPFTREGMSNVKKIGSLDVFENNSVQLTDQLLFELKGATNLKSLAIVNNNLTLASGQTLRTLKNLESLDLRQNTSVTDQLLASLGPLTDLTTLYLTKTSCSVKSVQEFRRLRKNCKVIFDDNAAQQ